MDLNVTQNVGRPTITVTQQTTAVNLTVSTDVNTVSFNVATNVNEVKIQPILNTVSSGDQSQTSFEIIDVVESAVAIDSNITILKEYNLGKLSGFKQIDLKVLFKRVGAYDSQMRIITYLIREDDNQGGILGFNYYSGVNVSQSFLKRTITLRELSNQIEYYSKDTSSASDENMYGDNSIINEVNFNTNWKIVICSTSPNFKTYHTNITKR